MILRSTLVVALGCEGAGRGWHHEDGHLPDRTGVRV